MGIAVKLKNITHSFKDNLILDDISINFYENKIYGLLGKNGVGKTTLLNIISNHIIFLVVLYHSLYKNMSIV